MCEWERGGGGGGGGGAGGGGGRELYMHAVYWDIFKGSLSVSMYVSINVFNVRSPINGINGSPVLN